MDHYREEQNREYAAYVQAKSYSKAQKPLSNEGRHFNLVSKHSKDDVLRPVIKDSGGAGDRPKYDKSCTEKSLSRENWRESTDNSSVQPIDCKMPLNRRNEHRKRAGKYAASVCGSEHSTDSRRSQHSSKSLRKIVKSQCKLHEEITSLLEDVTLYTERENITSDVKVEVAPTQSPASQRGNSSFYEPSTSRAAPKMQFKEVLPTLSQETPYYEGAKATIISAKPETKHPPREASDTAYQLRDPQETPPTEIKISLEDMVQAKIVNPIIKKCCRMYVDSMTSEVSIMEDLENMSKNVHELYKKTIFKKSINNDNNNKNNTTYDMTP